MKNELAQAVKQVLEDHQNGYKNLMVDSGDSLSESKVVLPAAEANNFAQHSVADRSVMSWQARLLTTDDHEKAQKKFRAAYQQLQGLQVKVGSRSYRLHAAYDKPDMNEKFTAIVFDLEPVNSYSEKIKVEVQLNFQIPMEWVVGVLVYDRERKDTDPGRVLRSF